MLNSEAGTDFPKERGVPIWIVYALIFLVAGIVLIKIYRWKHTPTEERIYDYAVQEVENDLSVFSKTNVYFEEFDQDFVTLKSDNVYDVEVAVQVTDDYGEKNYIYDVRVKVKNGICNTIYCMRRMDSKKGGENES